MIFDITRKSDGTYDAIWRNDQHEVLFHWALLHDAPQYWHAAFLNMIASAEAKQERFIKILKDTDQLKNCIVNEEGLEFSFLKMLCGFLRALETNHQGNFRHHKDAAIRNKKEKVVKFAQRYFADYEKAKNNIRTYLQANKSLNFVAYYASAEDCCHYAIVLARTGIQRPIHFPGQAAFIADARWGMLIRNHLRPFKASKRSQNIAQSTTDRHHDPLDIILINYELIVEIVCQQCLLDDLNISAAVFKLRSLTSFSKALLAYLDNGSSAKSLHHRRRLLPLICALIVKDEYEDVENQKIYLERILSDHDQLPDEKYQLLIKIVNDFQNDFLAGHNEINSRLTLVSAMSQFYLGQYDLDRASMFWKDLEPTKHELLLRSILAFYRFPHLYASVVMVWCAAVLLYAFLPRPKPVVMALRWIAVIVPLGILSITVLGLLYIAIRFLLRRVPHYGELFLPRLFGAIVVGLSVLLFQDTSWFISLSINWWNWFIMCLIVFILSFLYIFINVHKTIRLLPLPTSLSTQRSLNATTRVFSIGFIEAFTAVLLTSSLTYKVVLPTELITDLVFNRQGIIFALGPALEIGIFAKLIVLWTGLTLFIGAFVQSLWQEQQMTSS